MRPDITGEAVRVNVFSTGSGEDARGWQDKFAGFDTDSVEDLTEKINGFAIREGLEPGVYVATAAVIRFNERPALYLYTFMVYDTTAVQPVTIKLG